MDNISPETKEPMTESNSLSHLSEEEKAEQTKLWCKELATIEDEIDMLKTALTLKMRRCAELKHSLGIRDRKEVSGDLKDVEENDIREIAETIFEDYYKYSKVEN